MTQGGNIMIKNVMTGTYIKDGENYNFDFYTDLSAYDKLKFVKSVTNTLVGDDYNSIIRDLIFDFYIVDIFAINVDTSFVKNNEEEPTVNPIISIEEFLEDNNIAEIIKVNAEDGLIDELNKAIDENIEYRTGIHKNTLNDALTGLINTLEKKLNDVDLGSMLEVMESFGGITDEFTPQNIVNAYMNTDVAKNNIKELDETRKRNAEFAEEVSKVIDISKK